jgi:hypothetical protein
MRREWKSSVKSKRAVTNLRLYQHILRVINEQDYPGPIAE